jgi:hypothetical protein
MREDRSNGARLGGRFGFPRGRVKMLDNRLVHAIIGGKDPRSVASEINGNLLLLSDVSTSLIFLVGVLMTGFFICSGLALGHGCLLLMS